MMACFELSKMREEEEEGYKKLIQSKKKYIYPSLPLPELLACFIIFHIGVVYSLYKFYRVSQRYAAFLDLSSDQNNLMCTVQDQSDMEWYIWPSLLLSISHWIVVHMALSSIIRKYYPQLLSHFYITYSMLLITYIFGVAGPVLCFVVPSIMFVVLLSRVKLLIWLSWCLILILFNTRFIIAYLEYSMNDIPYGDYMISVMVAWIILRSLSFSLETCDLDPAGDGHNLTLFITLLAYCFYLPHIFTGPYMPFVDFRKGLTGPYTCWTLRKAISICLHLVRFLFWIQVCNVALCFFFAHAMLYEVNIITSMDCWETAGYVYFLCAFFLMKYVVLYGLPNVISKVEGYEPPHHPKCVILTYRFSDIWRLFDHGLYRFMLKHIYISWVPRDAGLVRQLQGTALVFIFVYVWHGISPSIFWWATFNYLGLTIEKLADTCASQEFYQKFESHYLPGAWVRRFYCMCAVFLYLPSIIALTIFLSNMSNSVVVAQKAFGIPECTATTFFFFYCLAQCSMEVHNWRHRTKLKET